jgi:hypothetical protein
MQETEKFRWNVNENGNFCVDYMYRTLIQPIEPADNNKNIWKMKISQVFACIFIDGLFSLRTTLQNAIDREVKIKRVFCHHDETTKYLLFQY